MAFFHYILDSKINGITRSDSVLQPKSSIYKSSKISSPVFGTPSEVGSSLTLLQDLHNLCEKQVPSYKFDFNSPYFAKYIVLSWVENVIFTVVNFPLFFILKLCGQESET